MTKDFFIRENTDSITHNYTNINPKTRQKQTRDSLFNIAKDKLAKPKINDSIIIDSDNTYVASKIYPELNLSKPKPKILELKVNPNIEKIIKAIEKLNKDKKIDIPYWAEKIDRISSKYNFPPELLIAIVNKESSFEKNIKRKTGNGPMGVTTIAVQAFFPGAKGNWNDFYKQMNEPLLNDILYEKSIEGDFRKDANGNFILKYKTPKELQKACAKDDELGMKVGLLAFQMKYVCAVAGKHYKNSSIVNAIPKTIKALKNGNLKLNEADNKKCVEIALKSYNSVFSSYANTVIRTLATQGMKFNNSYI